MVLAGWAVWHMDKDCMWNLLGETDTEFSNALGVANPEGEEMMMPDNSNRICCLFGTLLVLSKKKRVYLIVI